MRLIDADALKRTIEHRCVLSTLDAPRPLAYGSTDINDLIDAQPTIAEIDLKLIGMVNCKDCKFWKHQGWKSGWCEQFNGAVTSDNGYCYRAQRSDEVENDRKG